MPSLGRGGGCAYARCSLAAMWLTVVLLLRADRPWPAAEAAPVAATAAQSRRIGRVDGMNYLTKFGYISAASMEGEATVELVSAALKSFQRMARINETGDIDTATADMMARPRCGLADVELGGDGGVGGRRSKRYLLAGTRWNLANRPAITWRVLRYTSQLAQSVVDRELDRAFQMWADVTPLKFERRSSGPVDIEIAFAAAYHNDAYPFDGRGGTLAHAFYPPSNDQGFTISGDTHFDDSEPWTVASPSGVNLLYVAVHEFGHSLGLQHSNVAGSIMWPWAGAFDPNNPLKLAYDDVVGIQSLYGSAARGGATTTNPAPPTRTATIAATTAATTTKTTAAAAARTTLRTPPPPPPPPPPPTKTTTTPPPQPPSPPRPTTPSTARTTTTTARAPAPSPPASAATTTPASRTATTRAATTRTATAYATTTEGADCPVSLDEIVHAVDGHVYGFRGGSVYRFLERASGVQEGFPKPIGEVFPHAPPDGVDAAVTFQGPFAQAKTYMFKGDRYYRYSPLVASGGAGARMVLDAGFPKAIADGWGFREKNFDAVFLLNDSRSLYFVKGTQYWRHSGTARGAFPGYPRSLSSHALFRQLPGVSAAFRRADGVTYFFDGEQYYRYDERRAVQGPARSSPLIGPRPTGLWWFGCVLDRLRAPSMSDFGAGGSGDRDYDDSERR